MEATNSTTSALEATIPPAIIDPKIVLEEVLATKARSEEAAAQAEGHAQSIATKANDIEQLRSQMVRGLEEIAAGRSAANEILEESRTQIEQVRTTINAQLTSIDNLKAQIVDTSSQAAAVLESTRAALQSGTDAASRTESLKAQVEQAAQVAAQRSQHIEDGRIYVDGRRAEIDVTLNRAQQAASSADANQKASQVTVDNLNALYASAQSIKLSSDQTAEAIAVIRKQCEEHASVSKTLADIASQTEAKIRAYETRLGELDKLATERLKTIEGLLPGATSAGLASAFGQRRGHYKWPQRLWQALFIGSVLCLLGLAFRLPGTADGSLDLAHLGISLLRRLPYVLPLIWLAIHSAHRAAVAQRVEEEYAFKETMSRSFEGYRREMSDLEGKVSPDSPLAARGRSHISSGAGIRLR